MIRKIFDRHAAQSSRGRRLPRALAALSIVIATVSAGAQAQTYASFDDWVAQTKVSGEFRSGLFTVDWQHIRPFQHTFSIGGWVDLQSAPINGFSLNVSMATAQGLGLNPSNPREALPEVPSANVTTLMQAYLEYANHGLVLRAGNQLIDTPFANGSDFRMIPATFQGISAVWNDVIPGLKLSAYRMYRFKPWWASGYGRADTGTSPFNAGQVPEVDSSGFLAFGADYAASGLKLTAWHYDFYSRLRLTYGEASYRIPVQTPLLKAVMLGVQGVRETDAGGQVLPYQQVSSNLYGAQIGFALPHNTIFVSYVDVPRNDGHFRAGGFVNPYLQGNYNSSPIYTDIFGMTIGSMFGVPGSGVSIKDVIKIDHLTIIPAYTNYHLMEQGVGPDGQVINGPGKINGFMLIAMYELTPHWKLQFSGAYKQSKSAVGRISPNFLQIVYKFDKAD